MVRAATLRLTAGAVAFMIVSFRWAHSWPAAAADCIHLRRCPDGRVNSGRRPGLSPKGRTHTGRMPAALTIGDFSRATLRSDKTLRHYHRVGLPAPAGVDDTGYLRRAAAQERGCDPCGGGEPASVDARRRPVLLPPYGRPARRAGRHRLLLRLRVPESHANRSRDVCPAPVPGRSARARSAANVDAEGEVG